MLIPYGMHYDATVSGTVRKEVTCEACGSGYLYEMTRATSGKGFSFLFIDMGGAKRKAERDADEALADYLKYDCDVVPCPSCGHVQPHMFWRAAEKHTRWMKWLMIALVILSTLAFGIWFICLTWLREYPKSHRAATLRGIALAILCLGVLCSVLLVPLRAHLRKTYDPNRGDPATRIQQGQSMAMLRTEFERLVKEGKLSAPDRNEGSTRRRGPSRGGPRPRPENRT